MEIELQTHLDPARIDQLLDLYGATDWAEDRQRADVERMLAATDLVFALIDRATDRLVGFSRVLTDGVYRALVFDVVVAPSARRHGLGGMLLDAIVSHPRLAGVETIELTCQAELMGFYRSRGFTDALGGSTLMRRTLRPVADA